MQNLNPTRAELQNVKNRIKLAESGHKLLKKKRDGLIIEFYNVLKDAKSMRSELNEIYRRAYTSMLEVAALEGIMEIKSLSLALKDKPSVELTVKNIMGVRIPQIAKGKIRKSLEERGYGLLSASMRMDDMAGNYEALLEKTLDVAEIETKLRKLLMEIEKTKRRVNALEYVLIPQLQQQKRIIALHLEEMDRETTFRLKKIKQKVIAK
ncbi:MAG: V-type ATP synthase subunit D [Candidatus Aenigmarchaeota archaeon]|nr:V-type ATP synthase subunit D [Candidatus Aenigmarchaeota archaeon]